jgi:hypothetical protein
MFTLLFSRVSLVLALSILLPTVAPVGAAEMIAHGVSFPFFDETGNLTHKVHAERARKKGVVQMLDTVLVEYFAPGDPRQITQRVRMADALWDSAAETLVGSGSVSVETPESRLSGQGFHFALATGQLKIHREFVLVNQELRLTSDRAVVDLVFERGKEADDVRLQDVRRCEAIGNLQIKVLPTATRRYEADEAFSTRAVYDGATHIIRLPESTRMVKGGRPAGTVNKLDFALREETRPAEQLKRN